MAEIGDNSGVTGEPQKLVLNYIARAEVARCHDGCP